MQAAEADTLTASAMTVPDHYSPTHRKDTNVQIWQFFCAFAGVHLRNGKTVKADLVVDASGKDSGVSQWLEKLGHAVPDTISVASGLRYTYRMYEMPDDPQREWTVGVCMDHPEYNRTAVVIPIETNKWIVSHLQCTGCTSLQVVCVTSS